MLRVVKVEIKLVPPNKTKYLYENKDYDNFEFMSPLNLWEIQDKYKNNFEKIKVLDVTFEARTDCLYSCILVVYH